jgi:hypothetical protein
VAIGAKWFVPVNKLVLTDWTVSTDWSPFVGGACFLICRHDHVEWCCCHAVWRVPRFQMDEKAFGCLICGQPTGGDSSSP